jgi:hypothetical protein
MEQYYEAAVSYTNSSYFLLVKSVMAMNDKCIELNEIQKRDLDQLLNKFSTAQLIVHQSSFYEDKTRISTRILSDV